MSDGQTTVGGQSTAQAPPPAEQTPPPAEPPTEAETGKRRWFPSALTVLAIVLLAMWILTFFIPSGRYEVNDDGAPVPGTYEEVDAPLRQQPARERSVVARKRSLS